MKKIYAILVAALFVLSGCANIFRDELTELHEQMDEILAIVDRGNLDPEISVLIKTYGLNQEPEEEEFY